MGMTESQEALIATRRPDHDDECSARGLHVCDRRRDARPLQLRRRGRADYGRRSLAHAGAHGVQGRPLLDGGGLISLEMPYRAEDAAIVPLTVRSIIPAGDSRQVKAVTIVIDENPSPVAAAFTFGRNAAVSAISTRVRVNSYTNVHAVAELSDNKLYMVKTYVKAAGGCSAPSHRSSPCRVYR